MSKLSLYFATNRNHIGSDQWIQKAMVLSLVPTVARTFDLAKSSFP